MKVNVKEVLLSEISDDGTPQPPVTSHVPIPVIRTKYNSLYFPKKMEVNNQPSMTIPDDAMSISELVRRFASGLPVNGERVPLYDGDEELTDLQRLDLSERQIVLESAREEMKAIDKRVQERKSAAQNARLDKIVEERVQKKLAEQKGGIPNEEK